MIQTLVGVVVGSALTIVSTLLLQGRATRTINRSAIYVELIRQARIQPGASPDSDDVFRAVVDMRRRAMLLSGSERAAALRAEQLLSKMRATIVDERKTGTPQSDQVKSLLQDYGRQLDQIEHAIGRRLRRPV